MATLNRSIEKNVFIAAPPERVFQAITTASEWDQYFTSGMELEPKPGGVCNFRWQNWGPNDVCSESPGKVLAIEPPKRFEFEWGRPGFCTHAILELEPRDSGTVLSLKEDGYPDSDAGLDNMIECSAHWGELLVLIKYYLEHGVTYNSALKARAAQA